MTTASTFEFNAIVGGGSVFNDGKRAPLGSGLVLDASHGPIVYNKIYATEIIACDIGVQFTSGVGGNDKTAIAMNSFDVPFLHLCKTHMQVGDPWSNVAGNTFDVTIDGGGIADTVGMRLFGKDNRFTLKIANVPAGNGIVFEEAAERNRINMVYPASGYTNNAVRPTNVIEPQVAAGFAIKTPPMPPSGELLINRTPFRVEVLVIATGRVQNWILTDVVGAAQGLDGDWTSGQTITLDPGEGITVNYTEAPVWRWRGR